MVTLLTGKKGSGKTKKLIEMVNAALEKTNGNVVVIEKGQSLTLQQIINMDWLAENITGSMPAYEELSETGRATVKVVGVDSPESDIDGQGAAE